MTDLNDLNEDNFKKDAENIQSKIYQDYLQAFSLSKNRVLAIMRVAKIHSRETTEVEFIVKKFEGKK